MATKSSGTFSCSAAAFAVGLAGIGLVVLLIGGWVCPAEGQRRVSVYPGTSPGDTVRVEIWNGMVTVLLANDQTYLTKDHPGPARDGGPIVIIGVACIAVAAVAGAVAYLFRNS